MVISCFLFSGSFFMLFSQSYIDTDADFTNFNKGISYFLLKDKQQAVHFIEKFFEEYREPALRIMFIDLITKNSMTVTKQFNRFLDNNHRSVTSLIGIALSSSFLDIPNSIAYLDRAQHLNDTFSSVYICMGFQYMKEKNYPQAELHYSLAYKNAKIPEYKIFQAQLYLKLNEPGKALALMKEEADRQPDNFYYNFYTAQAYFDLGQLDNMNVYVEAALDANPGTNDAPLLKAKYLAGKGDYKLAKDILRSLKFPDYNEDYTKTYGYVLFKLNDLEAKTNLELVYSKNRWDKDVNTLLAQYYNEKKAEKMNIQNWIHRALLCGTPKDRLMAIFPASFKFPDYKWLPFFDVKQIQWINNDLVVVGATQKSGGPGQLFFIDTTNFNIIYTVSYKGELHDIFISPDNQKIAFSATGDLGEYVYLVIVSGRSFQYRLLFPEPLPIGSAAIAFNRASNLLYITDNSISAVAFESPFSIVPPDGSPNKPVYDSYPFPIYQYNLAAQKMGQIKDMSWLGRIPIPAVKKYYSILDAAGLKSNIQELLEKGEKLDLTSSEIVKTFFDNDLSSFIIYLSDLKNAFQAILFERANNKILKVDETMFLGEKKYAELLLLDYDPSKKEILLLTKDNQQRLIMFNYKTRLSLLAADKVIEPYFDKAAGRIYALTERGKKKNYTETNLEIISLKPYWRKIVDSRRDIEKILFTVTDNFDNSDVYVSTFYGEVLKIDSDYNFHYCGPSLENTIHALSPSLDKSVGFINNRLVLVESEKVKWDSKKNLKK